MSTATNSRARGRPWALLPVGLLLLMFIGWGVMLSVALDDPGFGIEPEYYKKATEFDQRRALEEQSQRLAWSLEPSFERVSAAEMRVSVKLVDNQGRPIDGARLSATAFHNARSSHRFELRFSEARLGEYQARLPAARPGLWEFRFVVEHGSDRFLTLIRRDLPPEGPAS